MPAPVRNLLSRSVIVCLLVSFATGMGPGYSAAQAAAPAGPGRTHPPAGHVPRTTGGCASRHPVPASIQNNIHYQESLWEFSLRAYPRCHIPADAVGRAAGQLAGVPHSRQTPTGSHASGTLTATTQSDGTGQTSWSAIGPVGISQGWAGVDSGRVMTAAVDPTNAQTVYIGAAGGGVWKTLDAGTTWSPLTSGQPSESMGALAIDPTNANVVYAGTGEGDSAIDAVQGAGILKSTDAGATWNQLGSSVFNNQSINKIVVDPVTPSRVWANTSAGLYLSTDGGTTWSSSSFSGLPHTTGWDLVLDPTNHNTIFAGVGGSWGGSANGIYESTDGGTTWSLLGSGPNGNPSTAGGSASVGRIQLAIASAASGPVLYAAVGDALTGKLLEVEKSTDRGASWTVLANPDPENGAGAGAQYWYDFALSVDPSDTTGGTVWLAGTDAFKSTNGGSSWVNETQVYQGNPKSVHPDQHGFAFAGSTMYLVNDGGVSSTSNGGTTWVERNDTLNITQFYSAATDANYAPKVIGGAQDNGTDLWNGNISSLRWSEIYGGDGGDTAVDFTSPQTYYEEYTNLEMNKSTNGGSTWTQITNGISDLSNACFIAPFSMSANNAQRLLAGTSEVYESTNGGTGWTVKSPDLTNGSGCVLSLAFAPSATNTLYAGTDNGLLWTTTDDGVSWTNISAGLPSAAITSIAVDPTSSQVAYVTLGNCYSGGCVWRTADGGKSWQDITGNLPYSAAHSVLVDPRDPSHIYLADDHSVFESFSRGGAWTQLSAGLPTVAVDQLSLNHGGTVLIAGTHGRGMYELFRSWLQLSSSSGLAGSSLTVTGTGFQAGETVSLSFGSVSEGTVAADSNGVATATFAVPSLTRAAYTVQMQGATSGRVANQQFTVVGPTYVVNETADTSSCTTSAFSLRCAITAANADGGPFANINFAILPSDPGCSGTPAICTISLESALPAVTAPDTTINGLTQAGSSPNTALAGTTDNAVLTIQLSGTSAGSATGLSLSGAGETVRALSITGFAGDGVDLTGAGSSLPGDFIGVAPSGRAAGNAGNGIYAHDGAGTSVIGGTAPGDADVIENNGKSGVLIGSSASDTSVHVAVRQSVVSSNGGLGIDLAPQGVADCTTASPGPNDYTHCPVIQTATVNRVSGSACLGCTVDLFVTDSSGGPGAYGQGRISLGSTAADATSGAWSFILPASEVPSGAYITATATTPASPGPAETSEFAQDLPVSSGILTVTTTADNTSCPGGPGSAGYSLRCAIAQANGDGLMDAIHFQIPATDSGCTATSINGASQTVCTLSPATSLPALTAPSTTIDGYTQPGSAPNSRSAGTGDNAVLAIQLDGSHAGTGDGLSIQGTGDVVRGLSITNFSANGIALMASGVDVVGCFVGVTPAGTAGGNGKYGMWTAWAGFWTTGIDIGGNTADAANVVSANGSFGVDVEYSWNDTVSGNYIGVNPSSSTSLANSVGGVRLDTTNTDVVGGTSTGTPNVIAGNTGSGIAVSSSYTYGISVEGNLVGTDLTGRALANTGNGIYVQSDVYSSTIGGTMAGGANTIANNGASGILVGASSSDSVHVALIGNSIFSNGGLGIDLAPQGSVNCSGPTAGAPNDDTPCPTIQTATSSQVAGTSCANCNVDVFIAAPAADDQGHGEGKTYLGTASADSTGSWTLALASRVAAPGDAFTATATTTGSVVETSEFSANVSIAGAADASITTAVSTQQYMLTNSNGSTWTDMDLSKLSFTLTPTTASTALLGGNSDLWTHDAGYNQDIGIWISGGSYGSGQIVAWKESGGFAGTFSPNAAYVQTVVSLQAGVTYTVKLQWKSNKADSGSIMAGAGPSSPFSPTRLTAEMIPATASTSVSSAVSTQQYMLTNSNGSTWTDMDPSKLSFTLTPTTASTALLGGNSDLWTHDAGYNQDIGIWISGGSYGSGQIVAWKESGGFAGTFSPNAAYVQTVVSLQAGVTYTVKLQWKSNKADSGSIMAGAGPSSPFSPTRLTAEIVTSP